MCVCVSLLEAFLRYIHITVLIHQAFLNYQLVKLNANKQNFFLSIGIEFLRNLLFSDCHHIVVVGWLASLNDLTGSAGGKFMFLVRPPKPDRPLERGQSKREKLVLQEWGFCGWVGNPPKKNKLLISKDAQPWSWTPQETMAMRRCRNRSNDLIHGGRRWR